MLLFLFFLILLLLLNKRKYDMISKRILLIYVAVWGIVISISSFGLYDFYKPSIETLAMMVVHVIAFMVGYSIVRVDCNSVIVFSLNELNKKLDRLTSNKLFIGGVCVLTGYIISLVLRFFSLLAVMNMSELRTDFYDAGIYGSLFAILNGLVLSPINICLIPIFSWMCLKKRNWFWVVLGIFLLGYASLGGGRFGYLRILLGIVFVIFCLYLNSKNRKKYILSFSFVILMFFTLIGAITVSRMSNYIDSNDGIDTKVEATSKAMLSYAVGPISAFDYAVNNNYLERIGGYKYGGLTLAAPELFVYIILNKCGFRYEKSLDSLVCIKQDEYINVGDESYWNALYTSLLFYYLDLGWLGIVLFPFLFGLIIRFLIKKFYCTNSVCIFIILAFVFHGILRAVTDYNFVDVFLFLWMLVLYAIGIGKLKLKF